VLGDDASDGILLDVADASVLFASPRKRRIDRGPIQASVASAPRGSGRVDENAASDYGLRWGGSRALADHARKNDNPKPCFDEGK